MLGFENELGVLRLRRSLRFTSGLLVEATTGDVLHFLLAHMGGWRV